MKNKKDSLYAIIDITNNNYLGFDIDNKLNFIASKIDALKFRDSFTAEQFKLNTHCAIIEINED
jgi:hypothetical protein